MVERRAVGDDPDRRAQGVVEIRTFDRDHLIASRQRKPRIGRNPKTGDRVEVPAKKIPFFKPSKELKDLVNGDANHAASAPAAPPIQ